MAGGGELEPSHWPEKYAKSHFLVLLRPIFAQKMKTASPQRDLGAENRSCEGVSVIRTEEPFEFAISAGKSVSISVKTFFFSDITCFWAEKPFEFPISTKKSVSISVKTFFFGDHLFLGEKTASI